MIPTDTDQRWNTLTARLRQIAANYPQAALASSLAAEDMVLTHAILSEHIPLAIFTLDTGRLHAETLGLIDTIVARYGRAVEVWTPERHAVEQHVSDHGAFAFYESIALRKACCQLRKVEPLQRALQGRGAWLTGQRREQSTTRSDLPEAEFDAHFGLHKFNPLALWHDTDVWEAIRRFDIPYNPLHDRGYPSIGCEPCTRAVRPDEDPRAGRWWWESSDSKECGLHEINLQRSQDSIHKPISDRQISS
ncbi:phosphoadenylyl-sulfate reductase [Alcaligenaceae bacterium]|nr:phosphoadenylyl-sulfate reductase [Alcaligenaceae bacterium]